MVVEREWWPVSKIKAFANSGCWPFCLEALMLVLHKQ